MSVHERLVLLKNARDEFEDFRKNLERKQDRAGAIKAFEFTYDFSWKLMKDILAEEGFDFAAPKSIFRKAADLTIIKDPEMWVAFQDKIHLLSILYNKDQVYKTIAIFDKFSLEVATLITLAESL